MIKPIDFIKNSIKCDGPMSLSTYMDCALGNPRFGYYRQSDPIGKKGDFITAPEISQMFGELIGLWSINCWRQMGSPGLFNLIELGPGTGSMMADFLRISAGVQEFMNAISVHLIETNPALTTKQKETLSKFDVSVSWHESFKEVPQGQFILVANEFLDVFPIKQFIKTKEGWRERLIDLDIEEENLVWTTAKKFNQQWLADLSNFSTFNLGGVIEFSDEARNLVNEISYAIMEDRGVAMFIDYGYIKPIGVGTFQAVSQHKYIDPLKIPGLADLTAHVDFGMIARLAGDKGVRVGGPVTQGEFLKSLGIEQRSNYLVKNASMKQKKEIISALRRLTDKDQMGDLFKVITLGHPELPLPDGV